VIRDSGHATMRGAMRLAAFVLAASLVAACGESTPQVEPGGPSSQRLSLRALGSVDEAPAGYIEYLPPGYGDGRPRPLLIYLHGAGENGDGSKNSLEHLRDAGIPALIAADEWPERRPFVVLAPQHDDQRYLYCPDAEEVAKFIRFALAHYAIDRRRVYLTGSSCGAIGGWDYLGAHTDEVVAAAVLISGDGNGALADAHCALGRVPIWAFHGAFDTVVGANGSVRPIRALRQCTDPRPRDLRLTVYPGAGHDISQATYDLTAGHDIYGWLLRHRRTGSRR
jgi:predicted peptidase